MLLMMIGCRKESDNVVSYAFNDNMAFGEAYRSFAKKFDIIWNGLNTNYALWDFEKENGVDWDAIYDEFRPRFAALDEKESVTDNELEELLEDLVAPLHDGHLEVYIVNHHTGKTVDAWPGETRVKRERGQEYAVAEKFIPSLQYYAAKGQLLEYDESSNALATALYNSQLYVTNKLETETDPSLRKIYTEIDKDLKEAVNAANQDDANRCLELYNDAALRYEYMNVPDLVYVEPKLLEYPVIMKYALFEGNIAYLSLNSFNLSTYLGKEFRDQTFINPTAHTKQVVNQVINTWKAWFDAIQTHHEAGDLGGVIIDMRSNSGGMMSDFQFVAGALMPSGGMHTTNARFKRGSGRYDYSPIMPQYAQTMKTEHAVITEPIVVLCNCSTISMGEHTTLGIKLLENGRVIGTRTWGGLCALNSNDTYSQNYSGHVGIKDVTPVYCYVPQELAYTLDGEILEGYGVTPDIEVPFNAAAWNNGNGPDNQLDRALQEIKK